VFYEDPSLEKVQEFESEDDIAQENCDVAERKPKTIK
jgi:hypothetical protein